MIAELDETGLLLPILLIAAPFIGSFLGVVIIRLPQDAPILWGRSKCAACGASLRATDIIPILSWLFQRGHAHCCRTRISVFYPVIEVAALITVLWAASQTHGVVLVWTCLYGWVLLTLAAIDIETGRLPNVLTYGLLVLGLLCAVDLDPQTLLSHLIGAVAGYLSLFLVAKFYARMRKRQGLGMGDAKLLAAIGAWVGWEGLASVILIASVSGLLAALIRRGSGRMISSDLKLSFGPFLAFGGWCVWLYGPLLFDF